jgi:tRNA threonylcarbamoyladenosine biosynthesis protein TsaB
MSVVGIDTASATASVALVENGLLIAERTYPDLAATGHPNASKGRVEHAEIILPLVASLFETTGVRLQDITGFAVSIGPGSFTGLRIGLSTVKGLAYSAKTPVAGVSTLLAYAARVMDHEGFICPILDARKNEVYAALFRKTSGAVERLIEDSLTSVGAVIEMVCRLDNGAACFFVGDGVDIHQRLLLETLGSRAIFKVTESYSTIAATVARLGESRFRCNDVDNLGSLIPVYLRSPDAEFKRLSSR